LIKRIFLQVELASEEEKDAFKLWCQINKVGMSDRVRQLIATDVESGKELLNVSRQSLPSTLSRVGIGAGYWNEVEITNP